MHGNLVELGGKGRRHRRLAKLRSHLEEQCESRQPHGRLAKVHGGLAELSEMAKVHGDLAELNEMAEVHSGLTKFSGMARWSGKA